MKLTHYKSLALATTALGTALGMGLTTPAWAQTAKPAATEDMSAIIVTARRVEEKLQDVPISITVYNQQQLDNRNIINAEDLAKTTPSLAVNSDFGSENSTFALRGFTQDIGTPPTVGVYFGDVVAPRGGNNGITVGDGAGAGSMFDLQNVQVLKGPQGTLQGRNTTGGAVMLVPQRPTNKLEGYVEANMGNYNAHGLQAVLNVPLGDRFRMRLGVDRQQRDGYVNNLSGVGPSKYNDVNYTAARGSFVADLTPNLEDYAIVSFSDSNVAGTAQKLVAGDTYGPFFALAAPQLARQANFGFYDSLQDMPDAGQRTKKLQVINTTTWKATDELTVKNIISYAELRQKNNSPLFGTDFSIGSVAQGFAIIDGLAGAGTAEYVNGLSSGGLAAEVGGIVGQHINFAEMHAGPGKDTTAESTFTEEFRLQGRGLNDKLNWQGGFYFEKASPLGSTGVQTATFASCSNLGQTATPTCVAPIAELMTALSFGAMPVYLGGYNNQVLSASTQDMAVYAQATYALTSQLKLTGGIRYTWDRATADATEAYVLSGSAFCVATLGAMPVGGNCNESLSQNSQAPTWLIGLDYKPTDDILAYAKYSRGYRAGGVTPGAPGPNPIDGNRDLEHYKPEKLDSYEVGLKSSFHGPVSGIFDAAVFYNDFSDQQVMLGISSISTPLPPTEAPINVGKSTIWGIEVDTTLNLFKGFDVSAGYTYLNSRVDALSGIPASTPAIFFQPTAVVGQPLNLSPKNKYTLTGTYTLPLDPDIGRVSFSVTFTHTDSQRSTYSDKGMPGVVVPSASSPSGYAPTATDFGLLRATDLVDLNANWKSVLGRPIDLSFFGTNVTQQKYYGWVPGVLAYGFETAQLAPPEMYGLRVKVHF